MKNKYFEKRYFELECSKCAEKTLHKLTKIKSKGCRVTCQKCHEQHPQLLDIHYLKKFERRLNKNRKEA